ncbi:hypothetical protein AYO40_02555 [Planctomycetaceae bacterium SCGC AG-212-D15]|nr:hypothetical protein AYO40_02555 [Planctomycetaceae bacterium SCGC AG-212-D15]
MARRVVIEVADEAIKAITADGALEVLLIRYDDLLASVIVEEAPGVEVDAGRVRRLFDNPHSEEDDVFGGA